MYKIKQVSEIAGVSVRTLHHYDEIGLLTPRVAPNGYRIYSDNDLAVLQQILFFKELDFPLEKIKEILSSKNFNQKEALEKQKTLLQLKRDRLDKIIHSIDQTIKPNQGGKPMSKKEMFEPFNMEKIEAHKKEYAAETEQKWGSTDAYKESKRKTKNYTEADWKRIHDQTNAAYKMFLDAMGDGPQSDLAMEACEVHRKSITDNYYNCTIEIYRGLGEMYVADERFTKNINKNGEGLAEFMSASIKYYCEKNAS